MEKLKIGVLALQGAFREHREILEELGAVTFEIRQRKDLLENPDLAGVVIPGGESTVMERLLRELQLLEPLREKMRKGLPVLATCAGVILLAKEVEGQGPGAFGLLDILVQRNAYGRQLGSFRTTGVFAGGEEIPMTFIRAPKIASASDNTETLAMVNNAPVAIRQGNLVATTFHPELDRSPRVHQLFLDICCRFRKSW